MDANLESDAHGDGSFSAAFPLGLRILSLASLGAFCWASNLHVLSLLGVDTGAVLDVRVLEAHGGNGHGHSHHHRTASAGANGLGLAESAGATPSVPYMHPSRFYPPVYGLALSAASWTLLGIALFHWYGDEGRTPLGRTLPAAFLVLALLGLFMPVERLRKRERWMFLRSVRRVVFDPITAAVPFCDVILADVLTSFAKVLGDLWICGALAMGIDAREGWSGRWGVPFMTALPYLFRLRQCIGEHLNSPSSSYSSLSASTAAAFAGPSTSATTPASARTRSLLNALKYATAFPVILSSAVQGAHADIFHDSREADDGVFGRTGLFRIWVLAVLVNSLYSFWWDVTNDWGLALLLPSTWSAGLPAPFSNRSSSPSSPQNASSGRHLGLARPHARKASLPVRMLATVSNGVSPSATPDWRLLPKPVVDSSGGGGGGGGIGGEITPRPGTPSHQHHASFPPSSGLGVGGSATAASGRTAAILRPIMLLPDPLIYVLAIAIDLLLRLTWSLKLSSHLHSIHEIEQGVFLLEALEVVRRWMWVFIRVEWEQVRRHHALVQSRGVDDYSADSGDDLALTDRPLYRDLAPDKPLADLTLTP